MNQPGKEIKYYQESGNYTVVTKEIIIKGRGYSGFDDGLNNNKKKDEPDEGAITLGDWRVDGHWLQHTHLGNNVIHLVAQAGNTINPKKRDINSFFVHGEASKGIFKGRASTGCIIMDKYRYLFLMENDIIHIVP